MPKSPSTIFDSAPNPDRVGKAIRSLLKANGPVRVTSPYVSGKPEDLLGLAKSRWKDITLLCDLDSGNCDPSVLRSLLQKGARIRSRKGIHAKVYIAESGVAISSANFSPGGLGKGLIEAAQILKGNGAVSDARQWFDELSAASSDAGKRLIDPIEYAKLLAIWQSHQRGGYAGTKGSNERPSLLSAILTGSELLQNITFSWYTFGTELKTQQVKSEARRQGVDLPKESSEWNWFEWEFKKGLLKRLKIHCWDKAHVAWRVELDEDDNISRFMAHDLDAAPFLGLFRSGKRLVAVIGRSIWTGLNMHAERGKLAGLLTRGLKRAPTTLKQRINNDPLSTLSLKQLLKLVELGLRS